MPEVRVAAGEFSLCVRTTGDHDGFPVLYFHGTPGSRLDVTFADAVASDCGVHLVSFDRPGFGLSPAAPFSLTSVARGAAAVADSMGIDQFAAWGFSGGAPFALATAAVLGDRVTRVGAASGPAPFDLAPGRVDTLDENDKAALSLLAADPTAAVRGFAQGFQSDVETYRSSSDAALLQGLQNDELLSRRDRELLRDEPLGLNFIRTMQEGLRQAAEGPGWDNVAWIGPWDIELEQVRCPVRLWYGDEDRLGSAADGDWLRDHLPDAELTVYPGEGHLVVMSHSVEMLTQLSEGQSAQRFR